MYAFVPDKLGKNVTLDFAFHAERTTDRRVTHGSRVKFLLLQFIRPKSSFSAI